MPTSSEQSDLCFVCGFFKRFRSGRCYGCYRYHRVMGTERPDHLIQKAIDRALNTAGRNTCVTA